MANFLKSLFVKGVEIDTASATAGKVLTYDGTKFAPASPGAGSLALDDLSDAVITSPAEFQGLSYNGTNWVNGYPPVVTYVRNAEATTITTGTCVYLFGSTGDHASVKRADNNSDTTSSKTVGVVGASITASNEGPVITRGYVDGIDLSTGYTAGDILWLGEAGAFTTTKPTAPDHLVFIGVVVRATNNGIIYVATQNGYELDELHNVSLPSPASGDFLKYNGTLWVADAIDLGTDTTGNYMSGISGTSPVTVSFTPGEGASASVSLAASYGDTQNPYASKTANYVLAAPNGSSGVPTFRAIVAADIPTLNQNTTGTAATVTGAAQTAITSVGTLTSLTVGGAGANRSITINAPSSYYAIQYFQINGVSKWHYEAAPDGLSLAIVQSGVAARLTVTSSGTTISGTATATTFSGSGASLTSLPAAQLTGNIASARLSGGYTGITSIGTLSTTLTTTGNVVMNNGSPTAYFQDTDNRSAMIHVNSNLFYVLRGDGTNSLTWATTGGQWPLVINLENNNATVGNNLVVANNGAAPSITVGNWSGSSAFAVVETTKGYLLLGASSGNDNVYLRARGANNVYIGGNEANTLQVSGSSVAINGATVNDSLNVNTGSVWIQSMPASTGSTVVNVFGFLRYVSSRRELKENIVNVELSDGLDRVLALRPVEFTMKPEYLIDANELTPFDVKRGFIAQETAEVDHRYGQWGWVDENQMMATTPALNGELPLEEATPIYWNHDAVIADLVASIQNINARLQQLEIV